MSAPSLKAADISQRYWYCHQMLSKHQTSATDKCTSVVFSDYPSTLKFNLSDTSSTKFKSTTFALCRQRTDLQRDQGWRKSNNMNLLNTYWEQETWILNTLCKYAHFDINSRALLQGFPQKASVLTEHKSCSSSFGNGMLALRCKSRSLIPLISGTPSQQKKGMWLQCM